MPSQLKSQTARANGAKSRGPETEAGRRRSSQNAIKHGFTSQTIVLATEDPAEFHQLLSSYLDHFHPDGPVELHLVHSMVAAKWRLRRLDLIEQQLFIESMDEVDYIQEAYEGDEYNNDECLTKAFNRLAGSNSLPFLYRVQSRLEREYSRALRNLLQLQKDRGPRGPVPDQNKICKNEPTAPPTELVMQPADPTDRLASPGTPAAPGWIPSPQTAPGGPLPPPKL